MKKMRKIIILFLALLLAGGIFLFLKRKPVGRSLGGQNSQTVLFVGATCPHCKKVEEWLDKNPQIKNKSGLTIKEVYYDQENASELEKKADECNFNKSRGIGVPFLFDRGQCIIGDQPIIDYLSKNY